LARSQGGNGVHVNAILTRLATLLHECEHHGPLTPVETLPGAEIWRCETCGREVLYADELDPLPPLSRDEG
jgi:hypothetical protein